MWGQLSNSCRRDKNPSVTKALFLQHICREGRQLSRQHINPHLLVINLFSQGKGSSRRRLWRGGMRRQDIGDRPESPDQRELRERTYPTRPLGRPHLAAVGLPKDFPESLSWCWLELRAWLPSHRQSG